MKQIEREEDKIVAMCGINKFMYFSWNYERSYGEWTDMWGKKHAEVLPKFIWEIEWSCNFDHVITMWEESTCTKDTYAYIPRFYGRLGGDREKFLRWICENYNDEMALV